MFYGLPDCIDQIGIVMSKFFCLFGTSTGNYSHITFYCKNCSPLLLIQSIQ